MANGNTTDMLSFEDMGTNEPASEIMRRKGALQQEAQQFGQQAQKVTQQETQSLRGQAAMDELRSQTTRMKDSMKYRQSNFDEGLKQQRQLAGLDEGAKRELFDQQIQFQRDSAGRKFLNERQLADWMIQKQATDEDFQNFDQRSEQLHARKSQLLQAAYQKIIQAQKNAAKLGSDERSRQTQAYLAGKAEEARQKARKQDQTAANRSSIITGAFTVAGAVVAGIYSGGAAAPAGAAAGASLGAVVAGGTAK
jgi:hypothetical protein